MNKLKTFWLLCKILFIIVNFCFHLVVDLGCASYMTKRFTLIYSLILFH